MPPSPTMPDIANANGHQTTVVQVASLSTVTVRTMRLEARGIVSLELVATDDGGLAPFSAGSHIDLHLPNGVTRCYSLMNSERDRSHYRVGILRDAKSAGGSRYVHDELRVGQTITIGTPRNNFPVAPTAARSIVFAGGIGATPFASIVESLNYARQPWTMYYCARDRASAAFVVDFERLAAEGCGELRLHFDTESHGLRLDIAHIVSTAPADTHFYCCGPSSMMESFKVACVGVPDHQVHWESFTAEREPDKRGGFVVALARTGGRIAIPPGKSILEMLTERGIPVAYSCQQGICGSCETRVLGGEPDHRDSILSDDEKALNETMMICCSGALSDELVLDL